MWVRILGFSVLCGAALSAGAQEVTWRNGISQLVQAKCVSCHGASAPEYSEWNLGDKKAGPRMDTYPAFMTFVIWPATGALQRRLDDGKASASGKPGNMYAFLGGNDSERAANLAKIKAWLGDGAWNLNRWGARDNVPGVTREQLDKVKAKY